MKKDEMFEAIGLIDDELIAAAEYRDTGKKRRLSKRWIALVACLVLYSSTSTVLLATAYYKQQNNDLYIRYMTPDNMELQPTPTFDADKFFAALHSDQIENMYIAINRLIETFNDDALRKRALYELQPLLDNDNEKIADAAAFAIDILSKTYSNANIVHLADGSKLFTMFPQYSDYGSHHVVWRIHDNRLEEYQRFNAPSLYVREMIASPDGRKVAIITNSNKSDFVTIMDVEEGMVSPELVESARVRYGAQQQLDSWIRKDYENYSYANNVTWINNTTLQFDGSLSYQDMEIIESVTITYQFEQKEMTIIKREELE